ncbi:hypothetical protein PIB30_069822 [Stylosanthes scabra]|uniref:Uncharacterized protein n=1 Tax=Stylosanthes scabra TaxID=79078 RepID=A0ABU6UQI2_9FABA|nr:hypothetical protein [Stylosanthes scabra]
MERRTSMIKIPARMEPLRLPYNLRPRDRKVDYSSSTRPKRVTREESIREEEEKIQLQLNDPISQEEREEQYERVSKKFFLEKMYPYPLMAMKHYNKNRRKEEQFEVTEDVTGECLKHGNVGFFHSLHFRARPKRVGKILQNSSDEVDFFALLHMMPNDDTTHVCYCMRNPDSNPPDPRMYFLLTFVCLVL